MKGRKIAISGDRKIELYSYLLNQSYYSYYRLWLLSDKYITLQSLTRGQFLSTVQKVNMLVITSKFEVRIRQSLVSPGRKHGAHWILTNVHKDQKQSVSPVLIFIHWLPHLWLIARIVVGCQNLHYAGSTAYVTCLACCFYTLLCDLDWRHLKSVTCYSVWVPLNSFKKSRRYGIAIYQSWYARQGILGNEMVLLDY